MQIQLVIYGNASIFERLVSEAAFDFALDVGHNGKTAVPAEHSTKILVRYFIFKKGVNYAQLRIGKLCRGFGKGENGVKAVAGANPAVEGDLKNARIIAADIVQIAHLGAS